MLTQTTAAPQRVRRTGHAAALLQSSKEQLAGDRQRRICLIDT